MSFDTPHGTRGARQPGGKLMAWMNTWNMSRIRGNTDKVMGMQALVLTTVGAQSGTPRHTPVAYFPDGADSWLIVASANGAAKEPRLVLQPRRPPRHRADPDRQPHHCGQRRAVTRRRPPASMAPHHQHGRAFREISSIKPTANCRSSACAPDPSQSSRSSAPALQQFDSVVAGRDRSCRWRVRRAVATSRGIGSRGRSGRSTR